MRRVQVVLQPVEGKGGALGVSTDDKGVFRFTKVLAGRYSLVARHAGYLPASFAETQNTRLPLMFPLLPENI